MIPPHKTISPPQLFILNYLTGSQKKQWAIALQRLESGTTRSETKFHRIHAIVEQHTVWSLMSAVNPGCHSFGNWVM
jgi:hypothetical protein